MRCDDDDWSDGPEPYSEEWLQWARQQPDFCEMCGGFHAEALLCLVVFSMPVAVELEEP